MAYDRLADHDLSSLRLFITMSAAERLEAHLRVPCSNLFGITEGLLLGSPASARRRRAITRRDFPAVPTMSCGCCARRRGTGRAGRSR